MAPRRSLLITLGLLLGLSVGSGCAPSTSGSPSHPDSTTTPSPQSPKAAADSSSSESAPTPSPASSSSAETSRSLAQRLADAGVKARIKQALVQEQSLRAFTFFPEVVRGTVTLRGDVDTREQYRRAERIVRRLEGVETIRNQITVEGRRISTEEDASADSADSGAVFHTVHRGDTLWGIAQEYEVSVQRIKALNAQSLSSLQPGERIRVR